MKNKIALSLWIIAMIAVSILSTNNEARADEDEPGADYYCPEITLFEVHPCKFRYTISTMEEFGEDARAEKAILVEKTTFDEWFGYLRHQTMDITLVSLFERDKLTREEIFSLTTSEEVLQILLDYHESVDLFEAIRFPDWDYLRPQGGDGEKEILQKTRGGEWIIIDFESFDIVSREFVNLNIAYNLAILVENGVIERKVAEAYGIPAMGHEEYLETKDSFGELY